GRAPRPWPGRSCPQRGPSFTTSAEVDAVVLDALLVLVGQLGPLLLDLLTGDLLGGQVVVLVELLVLLGGDDLLDALDQGLPDLVRSTLGHRDGAVLRDGDVVALLLSGGN